MTGLGNNERKIYLGIANGKITYRPGRDMERQLFDFVEGKMREIRRRDATINNAPVKFYDFIIENGADTYALSVPVDSGIARGIILPLMSVGNFSDTMIRVSPWLKDTYTNVSVYANGQKLNWGIDPKELPPVEKVPVGNKEYVDDSKRVNFVEGLVDTINERLRAASSAQAGTVDVERVPRTGVAVQAPPASPAMAHAAPGAPATHAAPMAPVAPAAGVGNSYGPDGPAPIPAPTYDDGFFGDFGPDVFHPQM